MITLILFDLGGVVFTNGAKKFKANLAERYGLPAEKVQEVIDGEIGGKYRMGTISREEFWNYAIPALNLKESVDELEKEWIDCYRLIEKTRDVVLKLREKYRVMYLSDNVRERVERLHKEFGFLDWFEGGIFSHEVGFRKPDPRIFRAALEKAEVVAEEAVFIDDKPANTAAAQNIGMTAFLFESPEKLEKDLHDLFEMR